MNPLLKQGQRRFNKKGVAPLLITVILVMSLIILSIFMISSNYQQHYIYEQFSPENIIEKDNLIISDATILDNEIILEIKNNNNNYVTSTLIELEGSDDTQTIEQESISPYSTKEITITYDESLGEIKTIKVSASDLAKASQHEISSETITGIIPTQPEVNDSLEKGRESGEVILLEFYDDVEGSVPASGLVQFVASWNTENVQGTYMKILIHSSPDFTGCDYEGSGCTYGTSGPIPIENGNGKVTLNMSGYRSELIWYGRICNDINDCDSIINITKQYVPSGDGQDCCGFGGSYGSSWNDRNISVHQNTNNIDPNLYTIGIDWRECEIEDINNPLGCNYLYYQDIESDDGNNGYVSYSMKDDGTVHSAIKSFININAKTETINEICYEFQGYGIDTSESNPLKLKMYIYNWTSPGSWEPLPGIIESSSEQQLKNCINTTLQPDFGEFINENKLIVLVYDYEGSYRPSGSPYWSADSTIYSDYIHANYTYSKIAKDTINFLQEWACSPNPNEDWIIAQDTSCKNKEITITGDLIIRNHAKLTLNNITLILDTPQDGVYGILVEENTNSYLIINGSNITNGPSNPAANYNFSIESGNELFELNNSYIRNAGYGDAAAFTIESNSILYNNTIISSSPNTQRTLTFSQPAHHKIENNEIICEEYGNCIALAIGTNAVANITNNIINSNYIGLGVYITDGTRIINNTISSDTSIAFLKEEAINNLAENNFLSGKIDMSKGVNNTLKSNKILAPHPISERSLEIVRANRTYIVDSEIPYEILINAVDQTPEFNLINYLINSTHDNIFFYGNENSKLARQWYFDLEVVDATNNPVENANVYIKDNSEELIYSLNTNASGQIPTQNITQYIENIIGKTYLTPYEITAEKDGVSETVFTDLENNTKIKIFLGATPPSIQNIEINQSNPNLEDCSEEGCYINPNPGLNATDIEVTVTIQDDDENFLLNNPQSFIHFCLEPFSETEVNCGKDNANYTWELTNIQEQNPGIYTLSIYLTEENGTIPFYILPNTYSLYVNVTENGNEFENDPNAYDKWIYNTLIDYIYVDENGEEAEFVKVGSDNIENGIWSSGNKKYTLINQGNAIIDVLWNSTNFYCNDEITLGCSGEVWELDGYDFKIDDDSDHANEDTGQLLPTYVNQTEKQFIYETGLEICSEETCSDENLNETLDTYWHINIPLELLPGRYESQINLIISEPTLKGHWKFEEDPSQGTIKDYGIFKNDGTPSGDPQLVSGVFGQALEFDGDDKIEIPHHDSLSLNNQFTIEAWVKVGDITSDNAIISKIGGGIYNYNLRIVPSGGLIGSPQIEIYNSIEENYMGATYNQDIRNDGKWHHIAAIVDMKNDFMTIFLDGKQGDIKDISNFDSIINDYPIYIGNKGGGTSYFIGSIEDIKIHSRVLDPVEFSIQDIIINHLIFDEGIGNFAEDISGNNNYGILGDGVCSPGEEPCPDWVSYLDGYALDFDGLEIYTNINNNNRFNELSDEMTIELSLVYESSGSTYKALLDKRDITNYEGFYFEKGKKTAGIPKHSLTLELGNGNEFRSFYCIPDQGSSYFEDEKLYNLAIIYDSNLLEDNIKIYDQDGLVCSSGTYFTDFGSIIIPEEELILGLKRDYHTTRFDGLINELIIYQKALNPEEFKLL